MTIEVTGTAEIELDVVCDICGEELTASLVNGNKVFVESCEACIDMIKNESYQEGLEEGREEGE